MASKHFRIGLVLDRRLGAHAWQAHFLAAHRFAHANPEWEIISHEGVTSLTWRQAFSLKPDGVIASLEPDHPILDLPAPHTRVVVVTNSVAEHPFDRVVIDGYACGRQAAGHLVSRGLAHYAYVGWSNIRDSQEQQAGFASAMTEAGQGMSTIDLVEDGRELFVPPVEWFAELPRPCGILCANDGLAVRVIRACIEAGFAVPDDFAVMGIGDDEVLCVQSPIPLTSLALDLSAQTQVAAQHLDQWMRDPPSSPQVVHLPPGEIIERKSTCVFGESDPIVRRALVLIHTTAAQAMTVHRLVDLMGDVSRRRLEMLFRQRLGVTPYQEILHARIDLAKRLLRSAELSIDEIAHQAGFASSAHFSRPFRKRVGMTPSRYRAQCRAAGSRRQAARQSAAGSRQLMSCVKSRRGTSDK